MSFVVDITSKNIIFPVNRMKYALSLSYTAGQNQIPALPVAAKEHNPSRSISWYRSTQGTYLSSRELRILDISKENSTTWLFKKIRKGKEVWWFKVTYFLDPWPRCWFILNVHPYNTHDVYPSICCIYGCSNIKGYEKG